MNATDADLVVQARGGHPHAFDCLARRHGAAITALCWSRLRGRGPVEDLAQETFTRAFAHLHTLHDTDRFEGWLKGIAARVCADWLKAKARSDVSIDSIPESALPAASSAGLEKTERDRIVLDAVARLPEIFRETLVLFYYGEHTYREISALLDITEATVNARLTKARALLRQRLKEINL